MSARPPRIFQAEDLFNGKASLDGYPFRLIYLITSFASFYAADASIHRADMGRMDALLSAAELLEDNGWETVGVAAGGRLMCLRRRRSTSVTSMTSGDRW
jgi:hypothetical protein